MPANLVPGQYQIEDLIMGVGTQYRITGFEIMPYNVQAGDYQISRQDTVNFGMDQHMAQPINMTIEAIQNRWLMAPPPGAHIQSASISHLQAIWRGDFIRTKWGEQQVLYYCGKDGVTKELYGRTGKFQYTRGNQMTESYECNAEFRRTDAFSYESNESYQQLVKGDTPSFVNVGGDAPTWGRIFMVGPLTNPSITIGENKFDLAITLLPGEAAEISSYPWRRRAVDSNGVNIRAYMSGVDYLDKMRFYNGIPVPVRWTSEEVNTWVPELGARNWKVNIDDLNYWDLPSTFDVLHGKPVVRYDFFNFGSNSFPWITPSKYIASGILGGTSACLYAKDTYNTADQYCQAQVVEPFSGRSGIVIMSNDDMTNYAMLEVVSGFGMSANKLRIRNGTSPTDYGPVRAEWVNAALTWRETDTVSIEYDEDTLSYIARVNGDEKCRWEDTAGVVSTAATNRSQGFIFDLDGSLLTQGTGFKNILAYDKGVVEAPVGRVFVIWKNAYQVIE